MADFKSIFLEKFELDIKSGRIKRICDLGSGRSLNFIPLLERYPELRYVGIEPSRQSANVARESLAKYKNAEIINSNGYSRVSDDWGKFDLVISLSVLEHVKEIERFLANSIDAARPDGRIVHRWDLGHALHPSSIKERLQVLISARIPSILPESKFVRKLLPSQVIEIMRKSGASIEDVTYHQMPNHKDFIKIFGQNGVGGEIMSRKIIEWEFEISKYLDGIDELTKLKLFPTIVVWSRKGEV